MIACRNCRHVFFRDDEDDRPLCHHPKSFKEMPDFVTGATTTVAHSVDMMRQLLACGWNAKLFEPKER